MVWFVHIIFIQIPSLRFLMRIIPSLLVYGKKNEWGGDGEGGGEEADDKESEVRGR